MCDAIHCAFGTPALADIDVDIDILPDANFGRSEAEMGFQPHFRMGFPGWKDLHGVAQALDVPKVDGLLTWFCVRRGVFSCCSITHKSKTATWPSASLRARRPCLAWTYDDRGLAWISGDKPCFQNSSTSTSKAEVSADQFDQYCHNMAMKSSWQIRSRLTYCPRFCHTRVCLLTPEIERLLGRRKQVFAGELHWPIAQSPKPFVPYLLCGGCSP